MSFPRDDLVHSKVNRHMALTAMTLNNDNDG